MNDSFLLHLQQANTLIGALSILFPTPPLPHFFFQEFLWRNMREHCDTQTVSKKNSTLLVLITTRLGQVEIMRWLTIQRAYLPRIRWPGNSRLLGENISFWIYNEYFRWVTNIQNTQPFEQLEVQKLNGPGCLASSENLYFSMIIIILMSKWKVWSYYRNKSKGDTAIRRFSYCFKN